MIQAHNTFWFLHAFGLCKSLTKFVQSIISPMKYCMRSSHSIDVISIGNAFNWDHHGWSCTLSTAYGMLSRLRVALSPCAFFARLMSSSSEVLLDGKSLATSISPHPTVIMSGIQPSGIPHVGNYFGFIQPWIHIHKVRSVSYSSKLSINAFTFSWNISLLVKVTFYRSYCNFSILRSYCSTTYYVANALTWTASQVVTVLSLKKVSTGIQE